MTGCFITQFNISTVDKLFKWCTVFPAPVVRSVSPNLTSTLNVTLKKDIVVWFTEQNVKYTFAWLWDHNDLMCGRGILEFESEYDQTLFLLAWGPIC